MDNIRDVIDNGLNEDDFINNKFKETMEEYDTFKTFLSDTYDEGNEIDRTSINDLLDYYNETRSKKITRNEIIKEIKRVGLVYSKTKQIKGKRGVVFGLKVKGEEYDEEDW